MMDQMKLILKLKLIKYNLYIFYLKIYKIVYIFNFLVCLFTKIKIYSNYILQ
jgi:hypothetical protein